VLSVSADAVHLQLQVAQPHGNCKVSKQAIIRPANPAARCQPATDLQPAAVQCQRAKAEATDNSPGSLAAMQPSCSGG
jgi:hypothetical protein